jgi:hypothetical protein
MRRLVAFLLMMAPLCSIGLAGCSGEKPPKADPNWKVTTNPSDIVIPTQMKKAAPPGKGAPAPPQTK